MGAKIRAYEDRLCPAGAWPLQGRAPQGAAGLSPAFQRREYPMKEFVLKGRKIGGRYRGRILYRSVWRPCRARRRDGEIPGVKTPG